MAYPIVLVTTCTKRIRARKRHFLFRLLLQQPTKFLQLLHAMNILGEENDTFWEDSCCNSLPNCYSYYIYCTYQVRKMTLLRRIILLQRYPLVMVTTRFKHTRSRKFHLLRKLLLQIVIVTTCTEHTSSRKCHFLRRGHLTKKLLPHGYIMLCTYIRSGKCHFLRTLRLLQP